MVAGRGKMYLAKAVEWYQKSAEAELVVLIFLILLVVWMIFFHVLVGELPARLRVHVLFVFGRG